MKTIVRINDDVLTIFATECRKRAAAEDVDCRVAFEMKLAEILGCREDQGMKE